MLPKERFIVTTEPYREPDQPEKTWGKLICSVLEVMPDGSQNKIGEYLRNYGCLYNTWEPFEQDGKYFALCSPDYTSTAVMSLPECKIIASEPPYYGGFCPTGFCVPTEMKSHFESDKPEPLPEDWRGKFGFVCGCVWGDDCSWKIEFLDLSEITDGKITRDHRLGYAVLPGSSNDLGKYVFVDTSTEDFPKRLVIRTIQDQEWVGGLKWTADSKNGNDKLDLNAMADEMCDDVMDSLNYAMKSNGVANMDLADFKNNVRDTMIQYICRFSLDE